MTTKQPAPSGPQVAAKIDALIADFSLGMERTEVSRSSCGFHPVFDVGKGVLVNDHL